MTQAKPRPLDSKPVKWTVDDYHLIIDTGILAQRDVELIDGEIIEMTTEKEPHAYYSDEIPDYLREVFEGKAKIREGKPVVLPTDGEPKPDVAIVKKLGSAYLKRHPYPDDIYLLIEISDRTLKFDLNQKQSLYAAAGIQEYWVVNLQTLTLVVFRNPVTQEEGSKYQHKTDMKEGTISPINLPTVSIQVERLLDPTIGDR